MQIPISLAVLVSGSGRSLQNLIECSARGEIPARISIVISSDPKAGAIERARKARIPVEVVARRDHASTESFSAELTRVLSRPPAGLICMAGFLHLYRFPDEYRGRVMTIHPALLPAFGGRGMYGRRVHEAVLASGARESGCTVHFADHRYDRGPIVLQRRVPVRPGDTPESLADRVFQEELIAYPEAIRLFASGKLQKAGKVTS